MSLYDRLFPPRRYPLPSGAQDVMSYPKPRTITFGVDMNF